MDPVVEVTDAAPVEESTSESTVVADQNAEPAPAKEQETAAKPKVDPVQRRIDRLTREKYELRGRLDALERQLSERREPDRPAAGEKEPKLSDFDDFDQYVAAKASYIAEQKLNAALSKREQEARQQTEASSAQQAVTEWHKRLDAARSAIDDYDEVVESAGVEVTPAMGQAIMDSDMGPQVAYYLARHPDEAEKMHAMSPAAVLRAIGRIEAKIESESIAAKKTSAAPKPVSPVSGQGTGQKRLETASYEDFVKLRRKQIAARR